MNELASILPSAVVLGIFAVVALFLTLSRGWAQEDKRHIRRAVHIAAVAVVLQGAHFAEELLTGLHERLPELFGLDPMPLGFFVWFNVAWIVIWSASVWGLWTRHRVALFPLWFLTVGCIANGVAHPLLSVVVGGYFSGLVTSPVVGLVGVVLRRRLLQVTQAVDSRTQAV